MEYVDWGIFFGFMTAVVIGIFLYWKFFEKGAKPLEPVSKALDSPSPKFQVGRVIEGSNAADRGMD